jgi:hypothetical protein
MSTTCQIDGNAELPAHHILHDIAIHNIVLKRVSCPIHAGSSVYDQALTLCSLAITLRAHPTRIRTYQRRIRCTAAYELTTTSTCFEHLWSLISPSLVENVILHLLMYGDTHRSKPWEAFNLTPYASGIANCLQEDRFYPPVKTLLLAAHYIPLLEGRSIHEHLETLHLPRILTDQASSIQRSHWVQVPKIRNVVASSGSES